jgi:REP element-mobilizing transposase RayT
MAYTQLYYHLVFATKGRHGWLLPEMRGRLHEYLGGAIRNHGGHSLGIGGIEDHVHILAKLRQDHKLCDVLRNIKANSSGWIHQTFPELGKFAWQEGYAAFTVSQSQLEIVQRYIANQEKHHRKRSFQQELVELLQKHGIEFDERYLWK